MLIVHCVTLFTGRVEEMKIFEQELGRLLEGGRDDQAGMVVALVTLVTTVSPFYLVAVQSVSRKKKWTVPRQIMIATFVAENKLSRFSPCTHITNNFFVC